jgi:hypothetical protein
MTRTIFAMAVAGVIFAAVSGTSQAAPIAPLPAGVANDSGAITQVYWRGGWRGGWHGGGYWHRPYWHRRCWVGRWGRVHCW